MSANFELAAQALRDGARPDTPDDDGNTPLHAAAQRGEDRIAELLIEAGASLDLQNDDGRTPLHEAAAAGNAGIASALLRAGASPSIQDDQGDTALHLATRAGHLEVVALLVDEDDSDSRTAESPGSGSAPPDEPPTPGGAASGLQRLSDIVYWPLLLLGLALLLALAFGRTRMDTDAYRFLLAVSVVISLAGLPGAGIVTEFTFDPSEIGPEAPSDGLPPVKAGAASAIRVNLQGGGTIFFGTLVVLYRREIIDAILTLRRKKQK